MDNFAKQLYERTKFKLVCLNFFKLKNTLTTEIGQNLFGIIY